MANLCVRYGSLVFVMVNLKNVVFFMVKYRCVRYGCVRYDGTPIFLDLDSKLAKKSKNFTKGEIIS